jgi:hypothetical protein
MDSRSGAFESMIALHDRMFQAGTGSKQAPRLASACVHTPCIMGYSCRPTL